MGVATMDVVREFYAVILLMPNISYASWEVTICNTQVLFSLDEQPRFMGYERPVDDFSVIAFSKEDRPPSSEVFQMMLGPDTVALEGSNMSHG
ncbi:hypothetical protein CJ030_MR7G011666 [Morella rubra]|uniref:Uncharacterized protein n=1 Tax=Morella rubra TaxID=262757 RepID=A0A6A1V0E7_9ROSI|nr:hypothetical protein CJ030_MR7G011666 [Morella rubra]